MYFWMANFGLNLDPTAALSGAIDPFVPPILGVGAIAQFRTVASLQIGMYLAILAVSVNSILFVSHANVSLIQYKDNFIPKLLYWPVIASLLLGVTLWVFY